MFYQLWLPVSPVDLAMIFEWTLFRPVQHQWRIVSLIFFSYILLGDDVIRLATLLPLPVIFKKNNQKSQLDIQHSHKQRNKKRHKERKWDQNIQKHGLMRKVNKRTDAKGRQEADREGKTDRRRDVEEKIRMRERGRMKERQRDMKGNRDWGDYRGRKTDVRGGGG